MPTYNELITLLSEFWSIPSVIVKWLFVVWSTTVIIFLAEVIRSIINAVFKL